MPIRQSPKYKRWLQSEILLVIFGLGLSFLLDPTLFSNPAYAPLWIFPPLVWAVIFLGASSVGFVALYRSSPTLWKVFCNLSVLLLIWVAVARGMAGQSTSTVTYAVLAWAAALRSLGIPSATFTNLKK